MSEKKEITVEDAAGTMGLDLSVVKTYESAKERICFRLVNAKRNEEMLKNMPHIRLHDLAVVFVVSLETTQEGHAVVSNIICIHNLHNL